MRYKIGRYTTGITFVLLGLIVLLHQATDTNWLGIVFKLWPLVIIGYGVEYLLASRKGERGRFDVFGAVFIFLFLGALSFYSFFGTFAFTNGNLKNATEAAPIHFAAEDVSSMRIHSLLGKITVEATSEPTITIVPTYRSNKVRTLEQLSADVGMSATVEAGNLIIKGHRLLDKGSNFRFFGDNATGVDLHIYAPAHIATQIDHSFGSVHVSGMHDLRAVRLDFGDIQIMDTRGDVRVENDFGRVNIQRFAGALRLDSSFGSVNIQGEMLGRWDIDTDFGSVSLKVTPESSFYYQFDVDFGSVSTPFADKKSGTYNDGLYPLRASVSFGSLSVKTK